MSKKKLIAGILITTLLILSNIGIISNRKMGATLEMNITSTEEQQITVYYNTVSKSKEYTEMSSESKECGKEQSEVLTFQLPLNVKNIRVDTEKGDVLIRDMTFTRGTEIKKIDSQEFGIASGINDIKAAYSQIGWEISASGEDPYIVWNVEKWGIDSLKNAGMSKDEWMKKIGICLAFDVFCLLMVGYFKKFKEIPREIIENRRLIFNLAKNDFKTQYAGSYLGVFWAFVQPVVTVLVYWFVFEKGLRAGDMNTKAGITVPFVLWLIAGIVPWFFFQDALNGATNALTQYSYLVKKVVFKISILPVVKMISALFVHLFFIAFAVILYCCYGNFPDLYMLQIFYYTLCMFILVLGISYATCAIVGFFRDLTQIIVIVLQVGIWMTPIMWNFDAIQLPRVLQIIFKLNPMYYIVMGYRDAFINKVWFWEHMELTVYFWVLTILLFALGMTVFKKLKVHFADVL